ncbi:MAG: sigma-54 dependent transcriptional regulator [Alphaproteobacteria bacterium]|nr:sigma-54 dependent transcriptional regulator [Alphaproteobacteria bacterium]
MRILIIGTLNGHITRASQLAKQRGAEVTVVQDVESALELLRGAMGNDLVLIDETHDIDKLATSMRAERMNTPIVGCGLGKDPNRAAEMIRQGAKEYLPLPPDSELIAAVLETIADDSVPVVTGDPLSEQVFRMAAQIAKSEASVLITGPSGTGKEVMARYIHQHSRRNKGAFVAVNCAAIPENLLESELFGHEKGAFTGAVARRIGKFEEATGGTLLLDEISEMDIRLQAKLLRAIQEREIDRIGGKRPVKVNVRIVATSNRDLPAYVQEGNFREDLFFRLNVINLTLPALKDRVGDIDALAVYFAKKYAEINDIEERVLTPDAIAMLKSYSWPGNVRELENIIHRATLLATGDVIDAAAILFDSHMTMQMHAAGKEQDNPGTDVASSDAGDVDMVVGHTTVAEVERRLIIDTLEHCLGNRTKAATILGISIRTLRNKLRQYGDEGFDIVQPLSGM